MADNRTAGNGGGAHQRFNSNGSAWVYAYTLGYTLSSSQEIYDITADFTGPSPVLYVVTGESTRNHLVAVTGTRRRVGVRFWKPCFWRCLFRGLVFAQMKLKLCKSGTGWTKAAPLPILLSMNLMLPSMNRPIPQR